MNRPILSAALCLAPLLLAGCGGKSGAGNSSTTAVAADTQASTSDTAAPAQNSVVPVPAPSASPVAGGLPASFQGRWGQTINDCIPGRADAKGLMIVAADGLGFYESRATVEKVTSTAPDSLTLDLAFTGEGHEWKRQETLSLQDGGRTLLRAEQMPPSSTPYQRCPAGKEEQ